MSRAAGLVCLVSLALLWQAACARATPEPGGARGRDIVLSVDGQSVDGKVPQDATFETLLGSFNLPAETVVALLEAVTSVFDPRQLRAYQTYRVTRTLEGVFREFRYQIDSDRQLRVRGTGPAAFSAELVTLPREIEFDALVIEIGKGDSLVGVLESQGENVQLALELATIYGGEVDFNSDLQPGDRVEVLFERATRYGEFIGYGKVQAAMLENDGRRIHAVLFPDDDGQPAYYDEDGRSLKRQFLKSPLPFDPRITSRFSRRRFHPVHGIYRPHLGVDYGAAAGTRVNTVADGVVDFVGFNGEAGRMVRVRHTGGYQTAYLHLSAFAPGLRVGMRVSQGDFIGKVGSSGTATGPHLDYRIIKNGTYVDPTAELKKMPKGVAVGADRLAEFSGVRDTRFEQMATLLNTPGAAGSSGGAAPEPSVR